MPEQIYNSVKFLPPHKQLQCFCYLYSGEYQKSMQDLCFCCLSAAFYFQCRARRTAMFVINVSTCGVKIVSFGFLILVILSFVSFCFQLSLLGFFHFPIQTFWFNLSACALNWHLVIWVKQRYFCSLNFFNLPKCQKPSFVFPLKPFC